MTSTETAWGTSVNAEAVAAWDGPLFERFTRYRHVITSGLAHHGTEALRLFGPQPGQKVLDIGCGFGDATQQIAAMVGPDGEAIGVDASPNFIEASRAEAAEAGVANARFTVADVQTDDLGGPYDMAFSRFGTMFFAGPVAALRNVHGSLAPGGRLVMVVWRQRIDNGWLYRAQEIVEAIVSRPEEYEEPTCGPGPFSMANADTTSQILLGAGFTDVAFHRCDLPYVIGRDIDEAVEFNMALGPAAEAIRFAPTRAKELRAQLEEELGAALAEFATEDGIVAGSSTWVVTARPATTG
jgi:ubiquinone/menaquinone biosynthesis C-methylase UbiE